MDPMRILPTLVDTVAGAGRRGAAGQRPPRHPRRRRRPPRRASWRDWLHREAGAGRARAAPSTTTSPTRSSGPTSRRSTSRCCPTASARTPAGSRPAATCRRPCVAPTCGFFAEQGPVLSYTNDEDHFDAASLRDALRARARRAPRLGATLDERVVQRREVAAARTRTSTGRCAGEGLVTGPVSEPADLPDRQQPVPHQRAVHGRPGVDDVAPRPRADPARPRGGGLRGARFGPGPRASWSSQVDAFPEQPGRARRGRAAVVEVAEHHAYLDADAGAARGRRTAASTSCTTTASTTCRSRWPARCRCRCSRRCTRRPCAWLESAVRLDRRRAAPFAAVSRASPRRPGRTRSPTAPASPTASTSTALARRARRWRPAVWSGRLVRGEGSARRRSTPPGGPASRSCWPARPRHGLLPRRGGAAARQRTSATPATSTRRELRDAGRAAPASRSSPRRGTSRTAWSPPRRWPAARPSRRTPAARLPEVLSPDARPAGPGRRRRRPRPRHRRGRAPGPQRMPRTRRRRPLPRAHGRPLRGALRRLVGPEARGVIGYYVHHHGTGHLHRAMHRGALDRGAR